MPGVDGHQSDLLSAAFLSGQPNGRWELRDGRWLVEAFGGKVYQENIERYGFVDFDFFGSRYLQHMYIYIHTVYNYIYDYIYKRQMIRYLYVQQGTVITS